MSGEIEKTSKPITTARLSLGLGAVAISTREQLRFQLDHALARDAVHAELDVAMLTRGLAERGLETLLLRSAVEGGRREYLRRPDLGRKLDAASRKLLQQLHQPTADVVFVIADGLSALAVERHALALIDAVKSSLAEEAFNVPVYLVTQGRVAIGDEIGELLGAKLVVLLIGERPGLSSADSLGAYLTWKPKVGRTDAERNCVSNIRAEGLGYAEAAERIVGLVRGARALGATGVALKDSDTSLLD
jgi:ethanolamine ammonia-lyase small subunit